MAKLGYEVAIAALLLVILAPLMAIIGLCIVLESPGPVFYRSRRVGYRGEPLEILKFRKMHDGARGRPLTLAGDERFTRVGAWLARLKLDELPQLVNVVRGQMSLVGPRPEDPTFVERHADDFDKILQVRPGLSGLSQLAFAIESQILDPEDPIGHYERRILPQKLHLDRLYVRCWNPLLDIQVLWWTAATVVLGISVAVSRTTARMNIRRRQPKKHRFSLRIGNGAVHSAGARRTADAAPADTATPTQR